MNDSHSQLSATAQEILRLTPRRIALLAGLGVLTVTLMVSLGGGRDALVAVSHANWRLVALAVVVHYSGFAVRGHRWQQLLSLMGRRISLRSATAVLLSGWFASALLPARAGDLLRIGVLRAGIADVQPVPIPVSLSSIVLERVLDMAAILALGATLGFAILRARLPSWVLATYVVALAILGVFAGALLLAPPLLTWLRGRWRNRWWQALLDLAAQFVTSLAALRRRPMLTALVIGESLYIWMCDALLLWLVVASLGTWLPLGSAAFVALTVDIVAAAPLTPGAIGQIELANTALLTLVALPRFDAAAAVLLTRAISYWSFLLFSGAVTLAAGLWAYLAGDAAPEKPASSA